MTTHSKALLSITKIHKMLERRPNFGKTILNNIETALTNITKPYKALQSLTKRQKDYLILAEAH